MNTIPRICGFSGKIIASGIIFIMLLSGCADQDTHDSEIPSKVLPTALPTTFDTCRDIPPEIFTSRAIDPAPHSEEDFAGADNIDASERQHKGCTYLRHADGDGRMGVGIDILVTNYSVEYFRKFKESIGPFRETRIKGLTAGIIASGNGDCQILVDIKGGGLSLKTADRGDPCEFLFDLASAIVPLLPKS